MSDDTIDATGGDHVLLQAYVLRKTYESLVSAADADDVTRTEAINRAIALYTRVVKTEPGKVIIWSGPGYSRMVAITDHRANLNWLFLFCSFVFILLAGTLMTDHLWWGLGLALIGAACFGWWSPLGRMGRKK